MDDIVRTKKIQFENNTLFIHVCRNEIGLEYIKIVQNDNNKKSSIVINPNDLEEIVETLLFFKKDIAKNQKIVDKFFIKEEDKNIIISTFLKGITIKDLSLQFPYKEEAIRNLLLKNNIVIIEGIKLNTYFKYNKNFKKR